MEVIVVDPLERLIRAIGREADILGMQHPAWKRFVEISGSYSTEVNFNIAGLNLLGEGIPKLLVSYRYPEVAAKKIFPETWRLVDSIPTDKQLLLIRESTLDALGRPLMETAATRLAVLFFDGINRDPGLKARHYIGSPGLPELSDLALDLAFRAHMWEQINFMRLGPHGPANPRIKDEILHACNEVILAFSFLTGKKHWMFDVFVELGWIKLKHFEEMERRFGIYAPDIKLVTNFAEAFAPITEPEDFED